MSTPPVPGDAPPPAQAVQVSPPPAGVNSPQAHFFSSEQVAPVHEEVHAHVKLCTASRHSPPFWHGFGLQSSTFEHAVPSAMYPDMHAQAPAVPAKNWLASHWQTFPTLDSPLAQVGLQTPPSIS